MSGGVESSHPVDVLIEGSSTYKFLKDGQEVQLTDGNGRVFSDQSSVYWDAAKAVSTEVGFQVLVEGESYLDGRYQVWSVDAAGVIGEKSRWMNADQMQLLGYEDIFNRDLNEDGITGEPPAIDVDDDGLIDGSSVYKILKDGQGIALTNSSGRSFSNQSSRYWDVVKAVATNTGFEVLVEGESYLDGRFQVWSVDSAGVIDEKSRWMKADKMQLLGYEDTFDLDFNDDGITGELPAIDIDDDGLIDGSSVYKILNDGQSITITNSQGREFSNQSSSYWDVVKAVESETGFQVLVEGESSLIGRYQMWKTDEDGVIIDKSGWKTGDQMQLLGYEDTFNRDLNRDGTTGEPPVIDLNGDGLVDGASVYRLLKDDRGIMLTSRSGNVFSHRTSSYWDVVKAVESETGFQVLVEGESSLTGRYQMWKTDVDGVITDKSGWKTGDQMQLLGYEDTFNLDLNEDEIIGEPPLVDVNGDGLIDGVSAYKMLKDDRVISLTSRNGGMFSDQTSSYWDVVKAVVTDTGFEILVEGESHLDGRYQVWSVDAAGVIEEKSRWKTGDQMLVLGYEDTFKRDLNQDGTIGEPPAIDLNGDGLVDGATVYVLLKDDRGITLTNRWGSVFSNQTSDHWDVVNAVATDTGFEVLVEGESFLDGRYQVWSVDAAGVIEEKSRWKTGDQMLVLGYEDTFNRDLNRDGTTGEPPAIDLNGDGLVDGASVYRLIKDDRGIMLTSRWGNVFSNQTSSYWDVVKAVVTDTGFEVLVEGESYLDGRYQVWSVDAAGVIKERSRWEMGDQMLLLGYEDKFGIDLNRDEIIGELPVIDADGDGLIDGSIVYRILDNDQGIMLTNIRGRTMSDQSSPYWDVVKVVAADNGFEVLVEGESYLAGRYQVWSVDASGDVKDTSRWMMADQMLASGYEDVFNRDFNGDGLIAVVAASLD